MAALQQSVGDKGVNRSADVRTVQTLLNGHSRWLMFSPLPASGSLGADTLAALRSFQARSVPQAARGLLEPGDATWRALNAVVPDSALSGAAWWVANQARYVNSADVSALEPPFASHVANFIAALRKGGASVHVSATRRSKVRAYLMHYCWEIAHGRVRAEDVPAETGCDIVWDHGDDAASRRAAWQMVRLFKIAFKPSLKSRHIRGLAIDMSITWSGTIKVRDAAGKESSLAPPGNDANTALHKVGASYGVHKLLSDPPHWSDNGH
jgi:hypothetical protein